MNKVATWIQLLKKIRVTGAVAFSSDMLAKKMINKVDFTQAEVIIELGAGCGCITKEIAKNKNSHTKLLVFEVDEYFCNVLREKIKGENIFIINDSAENMKQHLLQLTGRSNVDFIISSLPFSIFNEKARQNLLKCIHSLLTPYSMYVQYGYNKKKYKELLNEFKTVNTSLVLRNVPPAYVFNCKKN